MKIKRIMLTVLLGIGLVFSSSPSFAGYFFATFDSSLGNDVDVLPGFSRSDWTVPYYYNVSWPGENTNHDVAYFNATVQTSGIQMTQNMNLFGYQHAYIEFIPANGISDHIIVAVQGYADTTCQQGYFAFFGYQNYPIGNPRLGPQCDSSQGRGPCLAIEKAACGPNWLYPTPANGGGVEVALDTSKVHRLVVQTNQYTNYTHVTAWLYRYDTGSGWVQLATTSYNDIKGDSDGDPITGALSFFGTAFQNYPVYFDHFQVQWY